MTVLFSKKCELALQAVLFLSAQAAEERFRAVEVAKNLNVPKEFISKVLQTLTKSGIVGSRKGVSGGFFLAKSPADIRLIDIVYEIDGRETFEKCVLGFPGCSPESPCPVHNEWGALREKAVKMLSEETLADFRDKTLAKLSKL